MGGSDLIRHHRHVQALAICLAALAGYIDAVAFIDTRGFFVSFMSGNTTRLGVGIAHDAAAGAAAAGLIATFVVGVASGSLTGHFARAHRRVAVLLLVTVLIAAAASCAMLGERTAAIVCMALAMGAENAVFERDGEIEIGLTYMTGTLVKLGQRLAAFLRGGDRFGWASYLMLWLGLLSGGATGALVYGAIGLSALWIAALVAGAMVMAARLAEPHGLIAAPARD